MTADGEQREADAAPDPTSGRADDMIDGPGDAAADGPEDPIDALIVECLQQPPALREATLAGLRTRHPLHASALQRRYAFLLQSGLIAAPPAFRGGDLPERVGGFRILGRLGHGGMGVVYLAEQESLGRRVALKMLHPGFAAPRARERFEREVQAISLLDHPNICPVHDAGELDGVPYLAMQYVDGETLAERIARDRAAQGSAQGSARGSTPAAGREAIEELLLIGEQLARALHAAHGKGLVHRDVKPENVMLEAATGRPMLLDFGLAQIDGDGRAGLTRPGDRLGTPAYMAPEQVVGRPADRRTDVYGLGATLYEALTRRVPHEAPTREALYRRILAGEITRAGRHNPQVPRELEIVLAAALDPDPDRRYATAGEFADDLRRVRERQPPRIRSPGLLARVRRWSQRHPYAATSLGALAAGLFAALLLLARLDRALRQKDAALLTRESLETRGGSPGEALRTAWQAVQAHRSPASVAALRAALQGPGVELEIPVPAHCSLGFDVDPSGERLAWLDMDHHLNLFRPRGDERVTRIGPLPGDYHGMCLRWSPEGDRIAVSANDGGAFVFDGAGQRLHALPPPEPGRSVRVFSVAWHPTRNLLAIGTGDAFPDAGPPRVHLWDLDHDRVLWSRELGAWPWHLRFVDAEHLAAAPGSARHPSKPGFRDHRVTVLPIMPVLPVSPFDGAAARSHAAHEQPCMEMAVSGTVIATVGHDRRLVLWDWRKDAPPVVRPHPGRIFSVDFAPDGESLVTACEDGLVRFFDRRGNPIARAWPARGSIPVDAAVFHPDGRRLLVRLRDRRLLFTLDGDELAEMPATRSPVRTARFLADGRFVSFERSVIRIWRLEPEGRRVRFLPRGQRAVIAPDGARLLSLGSNGTARLAEWGGAPIWTASMPAAWACIDCEGRAYSAGDDRRLVVVSPGGELEPFGSNEQWHQPIFSIGCAPRGGLVAASAGGEWARVVRRGDDGVWRTAASRYLGRRGPDEYRAVQTSFVWLKGATEGDWRIVAGTTRGVVELAFAGDRIDLIEEHLLDRSIVAHLAASPDEQFLAVDLGGDGLRLLGRREDSWEERAGIPFTLPILHLAFARDDRLLVTSARSVRIFDRDMELVAQIPCVDAAGFVSAHAHPGGDRVITVAANQVMREWWLDDRGVLAAAEQRIGSEERRRQAPHRGLVRQR